MQHYVLLDAIGIQKYIFDTNTLRIIIGASQFLDKWQQECSKRWPGNVLVSGGGNILAVFDNKTDADSFRKEAINIAPAGMEIAWANAEGKPGETGPGSDNAIWNELQKRISLFKSGNRDFSDYDQTFFQPVTPGCHYCGVRSRDGKGALDDYNNKKQPVCSVCRPRYDKGGRTGDVSTSMGKLWEYVGNKQFDPPFPLDLADLTRKENTAENVGEASHDLMAVVVVDLNDMGEKIKDVVNKEGFKGLNSFSQQLKLDIDEVFAALTDDFTPKSEWCGRKANDCFLRLRPLLLGGDDMALAMPAPLWPEFVNNLLRGLAGKGYPACAGVVVAKHTFPINRLVEMAEELVGSAKAMVRYRKKIAGESALSAEYQCAVDWHVHQETAFGSPLAIRKKHFVTKGLRFSRDHQAGEAIIQAATCRPYLLQDFSDLTETGRKLSVISNSKLFALYNALRSGCQATRDFLTYVLLRDDNEKLTSYSPVWAEVLKNQSKWPMWEDFSGPDMDVQACRTQMPDVLELLFLTRPDK
ncbi:hypothetical protein Dthio_PD2136 [Desulfonatronospira thiodismutans ASO3-1]|uniref:Uncharacterized protein n=1 Tax=Desulfonatronospira thiodismutans ASO3-1 TaxID=555779 RepID=D6SPT4_9BACT|nr:hypothetical protein [Desulfonatronospira thiodismutans]EFI34760.1 hypothetical protein Dthio_PD2136 [Desulfonatronospira thiodismutans ASO3-1]